MVGTQSSQLYMEKEERTSSDDNTLELSLSPPGEKKYFLGNPKRISTRPAVGWPPVGSYRKSLANKNPSTSSSPSPGKEGITEVDAPYATNKHLFVKIYMEGFPIGRKVDLGAYDSYKKLSVAIDELFGGLVAGSFFDLHAYSHPILFNLYSLEVDLPQTDDAADGWNNDSVTDRSGDVDYHPEYTLVYEDNEGDRILAGDVPWSMFVLTAKKLHLIRSSQLPSHKLGTCSYDHGNIATDSKMENER